MGKSYTYVLETSQNVKCFLIRKFYIHIYNSLNAQ